MDFWLGAMMARREVFSVTESCAAALLSGSDVNSPTTDYVWQEAHYPKRFICLAFALRKRVVLATQQTSEDRDGFVG